MTVFWFSETQLDKYIFGQWNEDNTTFICTNACKEVEKLTDKQNLVIVTGHSGSGKSAIIQHIALKYRQQGWIVKLVYEVKEILSLNPSVLQDKIIFVLNDPIGKRCFDEISYNTWEAHENYLKDYLKKCKLLLSSRKYILRDDRVKGILKEATNIVDIDDDQLKLNIDEKQRIWNIYAHNKKLSKEELAEIFKLKNIFRYCVNYIF